MSEKIIMNKDRNVVLTAFPVKNSKMPAFLLFPGGSYSTCDINEVLPAVKLFNSRGYPCFVLQYSVGKNFKWPYPMEDYEAAMQYLSDNAKKYHINMKYLSVIGFSAGGHLAAMAASCGKHRPYTAVICYGATNASTICYNAPGAPDANEAVNENTCPCFIASSRNDWIVPVDNTVNFINALNKNYIDYEAHIYGYSMHGFTVGEPAKAVPPLFNTHCGNWVNDFLSWLYELISGKYVSIRECCEYNDIYSEKLSSMNSCKAVFENGNVKSAMLKKFPVQYAVYALTKKKIGSFTDGISLKNLLQFMRTKNKTIEKIDSLLSDFENGGKL